jgi:predicted flavoprotein YhiN
MELVIISSLVISLILSNALWAWNTHKMLNKMMSRDFYGYQQAKQVPNNSKQELAEALKDVKIPFNGPNELDSLDEMIQKVMPLG